MESVQTSVIKCHKCRHVLLENLSTILNDDVLCDPEQCNSYDIKKFIYLQEDTLPPWIKSKVEEEQWTKGRVHCQKCGCRVGCFDYVSGRKCECGKTVLPPVHFIGSQVDRPLTFTNLRK